MPPIDGLLLDIDGVLSISWKPIPGAVEAMASFRRDRIPTRLVTNTTTHTRRALAQTLGEAGFDVDPDEIITALVATSSYLRLHRPGARVFVLSDGDAGEDLEGIDLVKIDEADIVVLGGASDDFTYGTMNAIFRRLMDGAELVGMHRNMYWRTSGGLELDGGAYITGLEEAAGTTATICGKPTAAYFQAALRLLDLPPDRVAMVGDDIVNDVLGAQDAGITGILVRTGKFREIDLAVAEPDHVVDSLADVPALVARS
jgi:HAD superfamily hydrolase (TIGR01458 family)